MKAIDRWLVPILCAMTLLVVASAIALGPGDLYEKDQPKTIAYTADVVLHGRFALPRDVIYQPATKPPLYNWIGAAIVWASGSWSEFVLKSPSVLGAIGVGVVLFLICRTGIPACLPAVRAAAPSREKDGFADGEETGRNACPTRGAVAFLAVAMFFAFGVDVRHGSTMRLAYLARPDMLQAFFLTLGWFAATRVLLAGKESNANVQRPTSNVERRSEDRPSTFDVRRSMFGVRLLPSLFWLAVIGAILTKGPLALLLFVYVAIAAKVLAGRWADVRRLHPIVGSIATIFVVGAWLLAAYRVDPAHVRGVMLGAEIIDRVGSATPEGLSKPVYFAAMWFVTKGGPIAMLAGVGAIAAAWRLRRTGIPACLRRSVSAVETDRAAYGLTQAGMPVPLMQAAALWLIVLIVGLSIPAGKRIDYLLPTYAPAALLAAWIAVEACRRLRLPVALAALLPVLLAVQLAHGRLTKFGEARERWTDRTVAFVRDVRKTVGDDPLVVIVRGKHPIPTLLGRHQGSLLTVDDLRRARWAILPTDATTATPTIVSAPVPSGFEVIEQRPLRPLGLYDLRAADAPTLDTLIAAQRKAGEWTSIDNPYRAAGSVWKDE